MASGPNQQQTSNVLGEYMPRHTRACNVVAFCPTEPRLLAAGLEKVRNDYGLLVWDTEGAARNNLAGGPGGGAADMGYDTASVDVRPGGHGERGGSGNTDGAKGLNVGYSVLDLETALGKAHSEPNLVGFGTHRATSDARLSKGFLSSASTLADGTPVRPTPPSSRLAILQPFPHISVCDR